MKRIIKQLDRITNFGLWGKYTLTVTPEGISIAIESTIKRDHTLLSFLTRGKGRAERIYLENQLIKQTSFCPHENIDRTDGLDECADCGFRNY